MQVQLSQEDAELVREVVADGAVSDAETLVHRLFEDFRRQRWIENNRDRLHELLHDAMRSPAVEGTPDEIRDRLKAGLRDASAS